jgi:hexokinase
MSDDALHIEIPDYEKIRDAFSNELTQAARGEKTSLPFILNQLPTAPLVQVDEIFQVFVIGGTNGEAATVRYNADGTVTIVDYRAHPELAKFKTAEDFLGFVDAHVNRDTRAIGINFAASLQPKRGDKGQLDGVLIEGETKGHGFKGLQQERVGQTIENYFKQKRGQEVIVSVGNDTVCLIASKAVGRIDRTNLAAGIVGTGYNMAFFMDDGTIVNVQASDFTGFTPTATGKIVDQESTNPGEQLFDKEVAKIYKHYNVLVDKFGLPGGKLQTGTELGALAAANDGAEGNIARALLRRSASLVAAQFAGLYNFKGQPERLIAVMQGGLYWEGPSYKEIVLEELKDLGVPGDAFVFEKVNRSDIIGAAMLLTGGL